MTDHHGVLPAVYVIRKADPDAGRLVLSVQNAIERIEVQINGEAQVCFHPWSNKVFDGDFSYPSLETALADIQSDPSSLRLHVGHTFVLRWLSVLGEIAEETSDEDTSITLFFMAEEVDDFAVVTNNHSLEQLRDGFLLAAHRYFVEENVMAEQLKFVDWAVMREHLQDVFTLISKGDMGQADRVLRLMLKGRDNTLS